jgi:hypothetical protein
MQSKRIALLLFSDRIPHAIRQEMENLTKTRAKNLKIEVFLHLQKLVNVAPAYEQNISTVPLVVILLLYCQLDTR